MGFGMTELLLIALVALVVIGPSKLPDIAKSLGKGYGEFKRSFGDLKQSINLEDIDKPSSSTSTNSSASTEDRREEIIDTYRSQWEQKLPTSQPTETKAVASEAVQIASAPKKDDGESSGR